MKYDFRAVCFENLPSATTFSVVGEISLKVSPVED
jgi:hypothetical protein